MDNDLPPQIPPYSLKLRGPRMIILFLFNSSGQVRRMFRELFLQAWWRYAWAGSKVSHSDLNQAYLKTQILELRGQILMIYTRGRGKSRFTLFSFLTFLGAKDYFSFLFSYITKKHFSLFSLFSGRKITFLSTFLTLW